jgi:hypothetical protein
MWSGTHSAFLKSTSKKNKEQRSLGYQNLHVCQNVLFLFCDDCFAKWQCYWKYMNIVSGRIKILHGTSLTGVQSTWNETKHQFSPTSSLVLPVTHPTTFRHLFSSEWRQPIQLSDLQGLNDQGSIPATRRDLFTASTLTVGPTHPPIQWVTLNLFTRSFHNPEHLYINLSLQSV